MSYLPTARDGYGKPCATPRMEDDAVELPRWVLRMYEDLVSPVYVAAPWAWPVVALLCLCLPMVLAGLNLLVDMLQRPVGIVLPAILVLMALAEFLGIWFMGAVLLRIWENAAMARAARTSLAPRDRALHWWAVLAAVTRLTAASVQAPERSKLAQRRREVGVPVSINRRARWNACFENLAKLRMERRWEVFLGKLDLVTALRRATGPVMVTAMVALISFELHCFFFIAIPWLDLPAWAEVSAKLYVVGLGLRISADYTRVSLTDPGSPHVDPSSADAAESAALSRRAAWCAQCDGPKPPRCHHCRICRRCVLKMDHHCVFLSNCVGLRNYRYFCFFLLDLVVACASLALALLPQAVSFCWSRGLVGRTRQAHVLVVLAVALIAGGLLAAFLQSHLGLLLRDETTLEFMKRHHCHQHLGPGADPADFAKESDPDCRGRVRSPLENFGEVFGLPPQRRVRWALISFLQLVAPDEVAKREQ